MTTPLLQRPTYLEGAPIAGANVVDVCKKSAPIAGLLGATLLGATAAYFVPKVLDGAIAAWRGRGQADDVEFDVE